MIELFDKLKDVWKSISSIDKRIESLEKLHSKGTHPGFICPSCGKATIRVFNHEITKSNISNYVTEDYSNYTIEEMSAKCTNKRCTFATKDSDFIKKFFLHL